jgi:hypothetical protein
MSDSYEKRTDSEILTGQVSKLTHSIRAIFGENHMAYVNKVATLSDASKVRIRDHLGDLVRVFKEEFVS